MYIALDGNKFGGLFLWKQRFVILQYRKGGGGRTARRRFCKIQGRLIRTQLHLNVSELTVSFSQGSSLAKSHRKVYKEIH